MNNYFVTISDEIDENDLFFEEAKWKMKIINLKKVAPVDKCIWEMVEDSEAKVIIDVREIGNAIAAVLYARYVKQEKNTFILISPEQEHKYVWGYGAGAYNVDDNAAHYKLLKLWRDIVFFFEEDNRKETIEPIREFLEDYWSGEEFTKRGKENGFIDFDEIEKLEQNRGEKILERLKDVAIRDDLEAFKNELKNVNDNQNLDYVDYIMIGNLCKEMDLKLYRVGIMEKGYERWKGTAPDVCFSLIDAYIDSPNIMHREKALKMVKQYFSIEEDAGQGLIINEDKKGIVIQENYIKSLLNAYISLERYDELIEIIKLEEYFVKKTNEESIRKLFLRNRAICMKEKGNHEEALALFLKLYKEEATVNTINLLVDTYESLHRYDMAARLQIALILRKYGKLESMLRLAKIMLKNSLVFKSYNEWNVVSNIIEDTGKQVIPLLMFVFSFEENQDSQDIIYDIYKIFDKHQDKDAMEFLTENRMKLAYIWSKFKGMAEEEMKYDFRLVDYIQEEYKQMTQKHISIDKIIEDILQLS